jgi:hypothetical protein
MLRGNSSPSFKIGEWLGGNGRAGDCDPFWSRSGVAPLSRWFSLAMSSCSNLLQDNIFEAAKFRDSFAAVGRRHTG